MTNDWDYNPDLDGGGDFPPPFLDQNDLDALEGLLSAGYHMDIVSNDKLTGDEINELRGNRFISLSDAIAWANSGGIGLYTQFIWFPQSGVWGARVAGSPSLDMSTDFIEENSDDWDYDEEEDE
jgi:hypothetical protein